MTSVSSDPHSTASRPSAPVAPVFDAVVVGGGPAGATAAEILARSGRSVALLDRDGRIKPCGGAVPPRLIRDFAIPDELIVARARGARIIAPSSRTVDMPIDDGYVGMVDRKFFDEALRVRAAEVGAVRITGTFERISRNGDGLATVHFRESRTGGEPKAVAGRVVIGADGARSQVARQEVPGAGEGKCVFAYHEIIDMSDGAAEGPASGDRCDVYYQSDLSPDFYAWIFPHGQTASVGTGSMQKGFGLRQATAALRERAGLAGAPTIRCEGAPIPLKPLKRWDNGRDVVLAGDAAGCVAPASGEGIYYAMVGGQAAAEAAEEVLATGNVKALANARRQFLKTHGWVFWVLGVMQAFWYSSDRRRERFVSMCGDPDVQRLTWQSYMEKELVRADPLAHLKIFLKDSAHLLGLAKVS